jgi:hypothetical protein
MSPRPRASRTLSRGAGEQVDERMPEKVTTAHIDALWQRMARIYGRKWTNNYGEIDDGTWLAGLRDVRPQDLDRAMDRCRLIDSPWPPTLPEFRAMCKAAAGYIQPPRQPEPKTNPVLAERELNRMKAILRQRRASAAPTNKHSDETK